ncbi:MAG: preprotein translocase subunit SecG [Agitococcus sp.]
METLVLIVHVVIASVMTLFILMQQGKGAEAGASFGGGGSQTVFGSAGSASFLTKLTAGLALVFFVTSMTLAVFAKQKVTQGAALPAPTSKTVQQPVTDVPVSAPVAAQTAPVQPVQNKPVETSNSTTDTVK